MSDKKGYEMRIASETRDKSVASERAERESSFSPSFPPAVIEANICFMQNKKGKKDGVVFHPRL